MTILRFFLFAVEVLTSILLIGIILIQKSKGGGLGLAFGGGATESLFGARSGNVLTKATVTLAVIFMANTVGLAILFARSHDATLMDSLMASEEPIQPVERTAPAATTAVPRVVEPTTPPQPPAEAVLEPMPLPLDEPGVSPESESESP